ncbi:MAG TPA: tetratricopeptide repeat protein, partial [Plasticicumulans sp.]|nr:tetratricopeptide repeat protein [Plasticicumulans sp.]
MDIRKELGCWLLLLVGIALLVSTEVRVRADHGSIAIGRDNTGPITIGVFGAELLRLIEAERSKTAAPLQAQIDTLARQSGVSEAAMRNFLRILGEKEIPAEKLVERFTDILQRHRASLQRLAALDPDDPAIRALIEQARAAVQQGDYDAADRSLAEAEYADLAAARQAEQLAEQARVAARQHLLTAAATRAERGDLAMTRIDYLAAAEHFRQATALVPAEDSETRADYLHRQANALYQQGDEFGDNAALLNAIAIWRKTLELRPRERVPLDWATTQNNLGLVLWRLGERESGTARLQEAVAAYRAALEERSRERVPLDWAATQNNLGLVLWRLGERESG